MLLFETVMCFRTEQTHRAECEILFHSDIRTDLSGEQSLAPLINTYRRTFASQEPRVPHYISFINSCDQTLDHCVMFGLIWQLKTE